MLPGFTTRGGWSRDFRDMKLEILQDNKTTKARVGTIMTVRTATGKKWVDKGYARDISQGDIVPAQEEEQVEPPAIEEELAEEPNPNPNND